MHFCVSCGALIPEQYSRKLSEIARNTHKPSSNYRLFAPKQRQNICLYTRLNEDLCIIAVRRYSAEVPNNLDTTTFVESALSVVMKT